MKYFHPKRIINQLGSFSKTFFVYYLIPDRWYLKWKYKRVFGEVLNLHHPLKFSEKIQWLKLYDRKEIYHHLVDKYEVKSIIAKVIGDKYIIQTLGVWDKFSDIDFSKLPKQFVLKCTHDSASITICQDKDVFDKKEIEWKYDHIFMRRDYYHFENKQWAYKGIKPRIIAEEFIEDDKFECLADYKFYCFGGNARCVYVTINRFSNLSVSMYDMEWKKMPFEHIHPNLGENIPKPMNLSLMKDLAEKIARFIDNPFVRVDFYETKGLVYFGEVTFYPEGGMGMFKPEEWDYILGSWIKLN